MIPVLDLGMPFFPGTPKPSSGKIFDRKLPKGKDIVLSVNLMIHLAEIQYSPYSQAKRCGDGLQHKLNCNKYVKYKFGHDINYEFEGEPPNGSLQHCEYGRQAAGGRSAPIQPFTWK